MSQGSAECFIPVKTHSSRVPNKNFRELDGTPLYQWIIHACIEANIFSRITVDTDSEAVTRWLAEIQADGAPVHWIPRAPELVGANGNELIEAHEKYCLPETTVVCQCFATSPFLRPETIRTANHLMLNSKYYDSVLTVQDACGWYWRNGVPLNYRSPNLPKSQEAMILQETTGLYAIKRDALRRYATRIGRWPMFYSVTPLEAVDIDTAHDLKIAELLAPEARE
jgi:N-acylneuraminate cytidylyltransferase